MAHRYGIYETTHVEAVGTGKAYEWNYTSMARIYDAHNDARISDEWN